MEYHWTALLILDSAKFLKDYRAFLLGSARFFVPTSLFVTFRRDNHTFVNAA
ncbi:hypothetical protein X965_15900 [Morganella sp. EGD-HP17]|nr:hypothetical protein X965_15900 [Morganella sp. EGD-HP17]